MTYVLVLLAVAVLVLIVVKVPFGIVLLGLGVLAAVLVGMFWFYWGKEAGKGEDSPAIKRNFRPISLVLRIVLAVVLYYFLCAGHLIPEALIFVPEFLALLLV